MPLFNRSGESLFEILGRGGPSPAPSPQRTLLGPRTIGAAATAKSPTSVSRTAPRDAAAPGPIRSVERVLEGLLEIDDDPVLVVDDEFDPHELAKEDTGDADGGFRLLSVRLDTAVVAGLGLTVLLGIAFVAGRVARGNPDAKPVATSSPTLPAEAPPVSRAAPAVASRAAAPPAAFVPAAFVRPVVSGTEPKGTASRILDALTRSVEPAPAAPEPEESTGGPARAVKDGKVELQVVSTTEEKAHAVVDFLNKSPRSPLFGRSDLEAYAKASKNCVAVRIRGFDKRDESVLTRIQALKDPTGGGDFSGALFYGPKR